MEFRTRPKSNYLLSAEWQELHLLTTHWQSDMDFFKDELRFINVLFDKYFTALVDKNNIEKTKEVAAHLANVQDAWDAIAQRINKHLEHIQQLIINPASPNASSFRTEHGVLEDDLSEFVKSFRSMKNEIFQLTERIAKTDKTKHLITG
jgi:glutaredoxin 2